MTARGIAAGNRRFPTAAPVRRWYNGVARPARHRTRTPCRPSSPMPGARRAASATTCACPTGRCGPAGRTGTSARGRPRGSPSSPTGPGRRSTTTRRGPSGWRRSRTAGGDPDPPPARAPYRSRRPPPPSRGLASLAASVRPPSWAPFIAAIAPSAPRRTRTPRLRPVARSVTTWALHGAVLPEQPDQVVRGGAEGQVADGQLLAHESPSAAGPGRARRTDCPGRQEAGGGGREQGGGVRPPAQRQHRSNDLGSVGVQPAPRIPRRASPARRRDPPAWPAPPQPVLLRPWLRP